MQPDIRFAVLTPNLTPGGAERHCIALAKYGPEFGLRCTGFVVSGGGGIAPGMAEEVADCAPLVVERGRGRRRQRDTSRVSSSWPTLQEALHTACHGAQALIAWGTTRMARYTAGLRMPVVLVSHCSDPATGDTDGVTHLVGVSRPALRFFAESPPGLPRTVIHNGAEQARLLPRDGRDAQRRDWGFSPGDVVIGNLGRHSCEKNPAGLIRALVHLPAHYKAVYYGAHPADPARPCPELVAEAADLGVADRVLFRLPQQHLGDVLAGLDVFTLLSQREANSLGLLEAFLAGVPTVATPVGALPELEEEHGPLCVHAPSRDPRDVAARIVEAAEAGRGAQMPTRTRAAAQLHWTERAMLARWRRYLESIV